MPPPPSFAVLLLDSLSRVKPYWEVVDDLELPPDEQDERGRFSPASEDFLPPFSTFCWIYLEALSV